MNMVQALNDEKNGVTRDVITGSELPPALPKASPAPVSQKRGEEANVYKSKKKKGKGNKR
jgi:hypothetical protein